MAAILHMSFRVRDPQRSAALYAELLDGTLTDPGPILRPVGVKSLAFGQGRRGPLADMLEFWPQDRHWRAEDFAASDPSHHQPFVTSSLRRTSRMKSWRQLRGSTA